MTNRMTVDELRAYERSQWSEQEFTDAVIRLFIANGWLVHHALPSRTAKGYRTAQQGHNGFPDLVCAKNGRIVFAELKVKNRKPTAVQEWWLEALTGWDGDWWKRIDYTTQGCVQFSMTVTVWQPKEWDEIEEVARS